VSTKLTLIYDRRHGQLTIASGANEATVWHSTLLSDPLADLAEAVSVLRATETARCAWDDEPGQYRWVLRRDEDHLHVTILWFPDSFSKRPDEEGAVVFSAVCRLRRFAVQVKSLLQAEIDGGIYRKHRPSAYDKLNAFLHGNDLPDKP
jgi:hypothetical protein